MTRRNFWSNFHPQNLRQWVRSLKPTQPNPPTIYLGGTQATAPLVIWENLRTLPAKTLYKSQEALTQRVPKLVLHNPTAPQGMPKRKTYHLVPDEAGDCYYPIGRDRDTLKDTGSSEKTLIVVAGSPTISRHHCTIYKPKSQLSATQKAQDNPFKAFQRYLSRTIQGEDYLLTDTRSNSNGIFRQQSFWQRLKTQQAFARMQQDTPLRHGTILFLTKPNAQDIQGKRIKPVTLRFIYPPIWYVREFWGVVRLSLLGTGLVLGAGWFAMATVRSVKIEPLPPTPAPFAIFANNGITQISGGIATPHETVTTLEELPPVFLKTLLLSEDRQYYHHSGVSLRRVVKAFLDNSRSGETQSGASTLTMQLARTLFLEEVNTKSLWGKELTLEKDEAGKTIDPDTLQITLTRKIREAGLALRLDATYDKNILLLAYLNSVDLGYRELTGQQLRGVSSASQFYFHRPINTLSAEDPADVARMASLIALIRAPRLAYGVCETRLKSDVVDLRLREAEANNESIEEPPTQDAYPNPVELAQEDVVYLTRVRNRLIQRMQDKRWITAELAETAQDLSNFNLFDNQAGFCERQVQENDRFDSSPIFLSHSIREELTRVLPLQEEPFENLILETSLDIDKQKTAVQLLNQYREKLGREQGVPHGALITIDSRTGEIMALVGEVTFPGTNDQTWIADYAANEYLPPGSTFKMFFYVDALKAGLPLTHTYPCEPLQFGGEVFSVAEYSKLCASGGYDAVDLTTAVARSDNLVPLKVVQQYSTLESVAHTAKVMGINTPLDPPVPRMAFGYYRVNLREITAAYGVLANKGRYNHPHLITAVYKNTNRDGCSASPEDFRNCPKLYDDQEVTSNLPVIPEQVATDMTQLLRSVVSTDGTGALASLATGEVESSGLGEAGKTGTSDDYQDGWFIGYVPDALVTTVWFGNFVQPQIAQPKARVYAVSENAAQLWGDYMKRCRGDRGCLEPELATPSP